MQKDPRVLNLSNGMRLKFNRAVRAVDNCTITWVDLGVSVRNLTLAESIAARAVRAKRREPLPYAEVFGLRFDPPAGATGASQESRVLAFEASLFVADMMAAPTGISA